MEKGRATKSHKKGSIIPIEASVGQPLLLLPPSSRRRRRHLPHRLTNLVDFCVGCGRSVAPAGGDEGIVTLPQFPSFPPPALESSSVILCTDCSRSNRILSCIVDTSLCTNDEESGKQDEQKEDDVSIARAQLRRYLQRLVEARGQSDGTAAALIATSSLVSSTKTSDWDEIMAKILPMQAGAMSGFDDDACKADGGADDDVIGECWALLLPCSASDHNNNDTACGTNAANAFLRKGPTTFGRLVKAMQQRCLFWVNVDHPVATYVEKVLPTLPEEEMDMALKDLKSLVDWAFRNDGKVLAEKGTDESSVPSEKILRYRRVARLAQIMSPQGGDGMEDAGDSVPSPRDELDRTYQIIFPEGALLDHSCNPNCAVVHRQENNPVVQKPVCVELLALRDIEEGERLSVSRMDGGDGLDLTVDARASALREVMGSSFTCLCSRCRYERFDSGRRISVSDERDSDKDVDRDGGKRSASTNGGLHFYWKEIKVLGDLAMQQGRHEDAEELYSLVLNSKPDNGDCLHAKAASYLERGLCCKSQQLWREAHKVCPTHRDISLAATKQKAYAGYKDIKVVPGKGTYSLIPTTYSTLLEGQCFITGQESPLLSPQECKHAIQWAEDAAKDRTGGWTTTRHYAVPTTDLPVHEIPEFLEFFNVILTHRLRPLMAKQFGPGEVGIDGCNLHVHDVFVVRYDAEGGQRHLPVHTDDSSHSFTIALNDLSDYAGGGTYVCSLGRSYRPSVGCIMTFRGDQIQHGGDPVVRGVRYVIVGFLYVDKHAVIGNGDCFDDISLDISRETKKPKLDEMFHPGAADRKGGSTGFSFGFDTGGTSL